MYAVVKTGGKQFKVAEDDILRIEKLDAEVGDIVTCDDVLLVSDNDNLSIGAPHVEGASVALEILAQRRARKVIIFKKRRRKSSQRKRGHKQYFTLVRVSEILTGGAKPSKKPQGMPPKVKKVKAVTDDIDTEANTIEDTVPEAKPAKEPKAKKPAAKEKPAEDTSSADEDKKSEE